MAKNCKGTAAGVRSKSDGSATERRVALAYRMNNGKKQRAISQRLSSDRKTIKKEGGSAASGYYVVESVRPKGTARPIQNPTVKKSGHREQTCIRKAPRDGKNHITAKHRDRENTEKPA